jgi:hypothetical protein
VPTCTFNEAIDVDLPGSGFVTVTATVPFCAVVEVPVAVSWVRETKVVVSGVPPNITVEPATKFEPPTVSEKLPTGSSVGLTVWATGIGFSRVTGVVAERVLSAALAASTVTEFGIGALGGA